MLNQPYEITDSSIIELEQGTNDWLYYRSSSITSTDISKCAARAGDKKSILEKFILAKNGEQRDLSENIAVQKGKELESQILKNFILGSYETVEKLPNFFINSFKQGQVYERTVSFSTSSGEYKNRLLSSHDGTISDTDGNLYILEAKFSEKDYNFRQEYILPDYIKQCSHHLLCNQKAKGCFLIISNENPLEPQSVVHYLDRKDPRVVAIQQSVIDLATSVYCQEIEEGDGVILFWQLAKSKMEIKQDFDAVAERAAKLHYETEAVRNELDILETRLRSLPFSNAYILNFKEYNRDVVLATKSSHKFAADEYIKELVEILKKNQIEIPPKSKHIFSMSYLTVSINKAK